MAKKIAEVIDHATLGNAIREERERQNLTQAQAARLAKMAPNYYSMIERGEKNIAIAKLLNILKALKMKLTISGLSR